jgi:hypothetical protein
MVRRCVGATVRRATVQACPAEAAKERRPVGHGVGCPTEAVQPAVPRALTFRQVAHAISWHCSCAGQGMSRFAFVLVLAVCTVLSVDRIEAQSQLPDLRVAALEELMNIEVTSASRREQRAEGCLRCMSSAAMRFAVRA